MVVLLEAFWAVGWTAAALIGYFVIPSSENGWRWAFVFGAIPALYALVVRWGLPESARWLERRGRLAEAESVVHAFESEAPARKLPVAPTLGGAPALFGLFAVFFAVAATAAWGLVDRRGRALDDR